MNIPLLIANILTALAFAVHTYQGDKEIRIIMPQAEQDPRHKKQEYWTMARCGWHWVSLDLLLASVALALVNFTDHFADEKTLLQLMSVYFLGYAVVWTITIMISKPFPKNYLKLGQWALLLVIAGLIFWGSGGI